ncbi:MAG: TetR family transcriptional regulator [Gordonia sp. (in: high G+C Gram-positive bacteria)]|uniref:TetR/AcrR family transcriptional regulator n=1 Tax=Gordonia sp. (in: high G+C Gram-positive bacteria) TaxID=84139 RepID=UPI0039E32B4C
MREPTPAPGRPARLSRDAIVAAALESDLSTLTMRDLAARLGVSHAALYRWVPDRDGLFDLISVEMAQRILPQTEPTAGTWREWLRDLAWKMHDEFLVVPGFAAHVAAPHRHNPESFGRLRDQVRLAFRLAGASPEMAEQSWYVFGLSVVRWIGADHADYDLGDDLPRFDLFLDVLLRGLPAREAADQGAQE